MIVAAFRIATGRTGISVEQIALTDQTKASPEERAVAGIMDIALKLAFEFVGTNAGKATVIEGKHIEEHVERILRSEHTEPFRKQLRDAGIDLPPQR